MKIAVEASALVEPGRTGVGVAAANLVEAAARALSEDDVRLVHFLAAGKRRPPLPPELAAPNVVDAPIRWFSGRVYHRLLRLGLAPPGDLLAGGAPDLFFFPNFLGWPVTARCRSVVLVHDLAFVRRPGDVRERTLRELTAIVPRALRRADAVVTVSESTARDIVAAFGLPRERITVIPNAVDHARFFPQPPEAVEAVLRRYGLPRSYVLHVGTLEPRKNVPGLARAWARLPGAVRAAHPLVLAGGKGWRDAGIESALGTAAGAGPLVRLGYVDETDLPALYSGAAAFAYPSHFEGFGLPVLEAMACGTPVVTASNTSLPEVAGDAALYADAGDEAGISDRLLTLLTDAAVATRCRELGRQRALTFRWEESGRRLAELFRRVVGRRL